MGPHDRNNLRGTFLTLRHTVPHLKKAGGGAIVLNASINGTRTFSNSGATAYACSKAGMLAIGQMLALELAPHRIRVNTVCPGKIDTEIDENTEHRDLAAARWPVEYPQGPDPAGAARGRQGRRRRRAHPVPGLRSRPAHHRHCGVDRRWPVAGDLTGQAPGARRGRFC